MAAKSGGVGFFDSGIGGLTVLKSCVESCGETLFYYYGDNARAPYGNKSKEELRPFVYRAFDCFQRLSVCAAVIACNTVTALFIDELRKRYSFPIVGAEPAVLPAVRAGGEVYALMTRNTFDSERFQIICERAARAYPHTRLTAFPCDGLAGVIEERAGDSTADYSAFLPKGKPDGVTLGCTHYVHIKEYVQAFYGCPTFDGNEAIAKRLRYVLEKTQEKVGDFGTGDPKREKNSFFCPLLSPRSVWKGEKGKKRRFCLRRKTNGKHYGVKRAYALCFLTESRFYNLLFYKRMFAFSSKKGEMVKNTKKSGKN